MKTMSGDPDMIMAEICKEIGCKDIRFVREAKTSLWCCENRDETTVKRCMECEKRSDRC